MVKLYFPHLRASDEPIDTREKFEEIGRHFNKLDAQAKQLRRKGASVSEAYRAQTRFVITIPRRLPRVVIARCPFCKTLILERAVPFSLNASFWQDDAESGRRGHSLGGKRCPHLFAIDGGFNLKGHTPREVSGVSYGGRPRKVYAGAEIPFVKPRLLNLPSMVAVLYSFPVANKYQALPVTYFAETLPSQNDFCVPWMRQKYTDGIRDGMVNLGGDYVAVRSDTQDYKLGKWVRQGKVCWLGSEQENHALLKIGFERTIYANMRGRQHPYLIKDGRVTNLPDPVTSRVQLLEIHRP